MSSSTSSHNQDQLFIGRLPLGSKNRDLEDVFYRYGKMTRCEVRQGMKMAFGFIGYEDKRDAEDAMNNEQGREIRGSRIVVEWTRSSGEGKEGGGRGRGRGGFRDRGGRGGRGDDYYGNRGDDYYHGGRDYGHDQDYYRGGRRSPPRYHQDYGDDFHTHSSYGDRGGGRDGRGYMRRSPEYQYRRSSPMYRDGRRSRSRERY